MRIMVDMLRGSIDGALAATLQVAVSEMAAARVGGRTPVTGLGRLTIDLTPGVGVDVTVATAESADKVILRATLIGAWIAAGAVSHAASSNARTPAALLSTLAAAGGGAAATRRDAATGPSLTAAAAGAGGALISLTTLNRHPGNTVRAAVAAATAMAISAAVTRQSGTRTRAEAERSSLAVPADAPAPPSGGFDGVPGLSPMFTPPKDFYVTDVAFYPGPVDVSSWRLRVTGMVDEELELSFDELLLMDPIELDATLVCVHNPVGGPRIGSARWLGVPLTRLLERAGAQPDAEQIVARSVDGFTAGVPASRVRAPQDAMVALAMNGEPLPFENGYPARLLTPGLWGADANTKWLSELELTTWGAVRDYWDRRGWPRQPSAVRPGSRIDTPHNRAVLSAGDATIAGVAWAPPQGVEAVEVSIDGGAWQETELSDELAPTLWRQWRLDWQASPGAHTITVRTRGRATLQGDHRQPPYPVGSSGHHSVRVDVVAGAASGATRAVGQLRHRVDDLSARGALAAEGARAWRARGYPPAPRWPSPRG